MGLRGLVPKAFPALSGTQDQARQQMLQLEMILSQSEIAFEADVLFVLDHIRTVGVNVSISPDHGRKSEQKR